MQRCPSRYELTSHSGRVTKWRVTGPGVDLGGAGRRGYLTLPPVEIYDTDGAVTALFGGNRRVAPSRHVLTSPDGRVLATFDTRLIARVVDTRRTTVTDAGGDELCTLVPAEAGVSGVRNTLAAALEGGYILTRRGAAIGHVGALRADTRGGVAGRAVDLARQAVERLRNGPSEQVTGVLESDIQLDPLLAAGVLLYKRWVLDPSRVPES